jgi:hypothetical protein
VCDASETELEDPKDLRAEIGKCPNSTNERKNMSTKTIYKRIALVAVAALGAGVLSVVPANATAGDAVAQSLWLSSTNSTTGDTVLTAAGGDPAADKSVGMVAITSAAAANVQVAQGNGAYVLGGNTGTANALANSQLAFNIGEGAASQKSTVVVSGGTITKFSTDSHTTPGTITLNGSSTAAVASQNAVAYAIEVTPNSGATSVTVTAYSGASASETAPTNGTLSGRWVITIVSASVSGVYSAADSSAYIGTSRAAGTACSTTPTFDNLVVNESGLTACVYVDLEDGYGANLATGVLSASATNGSKVQMGGGASDAYTASISYDSANYSGATWISVLQPVANTAGSTVVTISYQGVTVATKTISWTGVAASITLDAANSASTFLASGAAAGSVPAGSKLGINYVIKDAAGNAIAHGAQPTVSDATGSMISSTTETASGAATEQVLQTASSGSGSTTMYIADSTLRGAGTYKLKITNALGASIKSPVINATVVGSVATFTASWDKATYASGDIATLTIKGLDSGGRPAADGTLLGTGTVISVNTDGFAHLTSSCETTPASSAAFVGGVKTCKFAVKNTPGSYSYSVKVATTTSQSEVVGTATVSAGTAVSNADVLKAIVSLIASINKQIAALQKALLKR